jgi:hypothetical protein
MVSPTHAGLSGHCSVRRIEWCSFFFSGGVEGCWCFCSLFSCFISFFIDMHDDHAGDNNNCPPLLNVPSQPAANDGQFPSLHAIWPSFVFSTAHCHPMRVIARPLVQEKAQARFPPFRQAQGRGQAFVHASLLGPRTARGLVDERANEPHTQRD